MQFVNGICKLCGQNADLKESHHVPRFVIQWMKDTGGGYLRQAVNPNKRMQDGPKDHWLCEACEQRFSSREGYFAEELFNPVVKNQPGPFQYDERLFYCFISILWRTVIATQAHADFSKHRHAKLVGEAEVDWREYLLGKKARPKFDVLQVFLSDVTTGATIPVKKFNAYLARSIDATVGSSETQCFIYTKFGRFVLFAYLTECPFDLWVETQIKIEGGTLRTPQKINDGRIGDFLIHRAREAMKVYDERVSAKTKALISRHYERLLPKMIGSDMMRAQAADFNADVVPPGSVRKSGKVGRNDLCPCGSGLKYKRCHGF